jgi:hypothetical protein
MSSLRGSVVMIQRLLAEMHYVSRDELDAKPPYQYPNTWVANLDVVLLGLPTVSPKGAAYLVRVDFHSVQDRGGYSLTSKIHVCSEGGHFARWTLDQAAGFLSRSLVRWPKIQASIKIEDASVLASKWTAKRRSSLNARFDGISLATLGVKAAALDIKADNLKTDASRSKLYRQLAINLRAMALFADGARAGAFGVDSLPRELDPDSNDPYKPGKPDQY